jgi:hypothetical protein
MMNRSAKTFGEPVDYPEAAPRSDVRIARTVVADPAFRERSRRLQFDLDEAGSGAAIKCEAASMHVPCSGICRA